MNAKSQKQRAVGDVSVWLGVVNKDVPVQSGSSWWCFSKKAKENDVVVFYRKGAGIFRIDRVLRPIDDPMGECRLRGLVRMATSPKVYLRSPIDFKSMRSHPILREMAAVRRKFQGTCFSISEDQWVVLRPMVLNLGERKGKEVI